MPGKTRRRTVLQNSGDSRDLPPDDSFTLPSPSLYRPEIRTTLPGGVCLIDNQGCILYQTTSFREMTQGVIVSPSGNRAGLLDILLEKASGPLEEGQNRIRYRTEDTRGRVHVLECDFTPISPSPSGQAQILIQLQDVTDMESLAEEILSIGRYQDVLGKIASLSVNGASIQEIATCAAEETSRALNVEYCKILIAGDSDDTLHLLAGVGWNTGLVGTYIQEGGDFSQAGFAIKEKKPVIVKDLLKETRFSPSKLLSEHQVRSGVSVPMMFQDQILGVMGAHTRSLREFDEREIGFLGTVANTVATILERWKREETQLTIYKRLFAQVEDGVILTDQHGTILEWNPAMERMSGYFRHEAIGKTPAILSSGRQGPDFYNILWEKIRSGEPFVERFINKRKDQSEFLVWERISPVMDPDRTIHFFLAILTDLSDREKMLEALRHTEQIKLVGQLAGGILHEIRNPLIGIGSLAAHISDSNTLSPEVQRQVRLIADEARRIDELLGTHLKELKPRTFDFQPIHLEELLHDVHSLLQESFRKNHTTFRVKTPKGLPPLTAARGPLQQVLINLFMNALEAMPEGGKIEVVLQETVFHSQRSLAIIVRDSGKGLPESVLRRLNEPFFTHGKAKGVGLGLSICRDILERHKGSLQIKSEPGKGTEVTVFLPVE